jgi:hypothetical protein
LTCATPHTQAQIRILIDTLKRRKKERERKKGFLLGATKKDLNLNDLSSLL